jgi:hypothetical protein
MRKAPKTDGYDYVVTYFSSDEKVVFPAPPKNVYALVTKTDSDDERVHREKIKALKRSLIPGWDEE